MRASLLETGAKPYENERKDTNMNKRALIVIDMQNDFIDGALGTAEAQAIVDNVRKKVMFGYAKDPRARIIFTRDTHHGDYLETQEGRKLPVPHCVEGTDGWQIRPELVPSQGYAEADVKVVDKPSFGYVGWAAEELDGYDIELVGLCTDICVVSNALILKAVYPENEISADAACCAGVTPEKHEAALDTMESCQIRVDNR